MSQSKEDQRTGGRASEAVSKRRKGLQRAAERGSPQTQRETAETATEPPKTNGVASTGAGKPIRITVDLPRDEHRALRVLAAESGATGMGVMRALLSEALEDPELAERVRERLAESG